MRKVIGVFTLALLAWSCSTIENNTCTFKGKKQKGLTEQITWVGEIAVMNTETGSFQVYFKEVPPKKGTYKVHDHLDFSSNGPNTEASVVWLDDNFTTQFWSVPDDGAKVIVNYKDGNPVIQVKNVKVCEYGDASSGNCGKITGQITIKKSTD